MRSKEFNLTLDGWWQKQLDSDMRLFLQKSLATERQEAWSKFCRQNKQSWQQWHRVTYHKKVFLILRSVFRESRFVSADFLRYYVKLPHPNSLNTSSLIPTRQITTRRTNELIEAGFLTPKARVCPFVELWIGEFVRSSRWDLTYWDWRIGIQRVRIQRLCIIS